MEDNTTINNQEKICKICNRLFANGKAMGGHMRSHLVKLPIPPKPLPQLSSPSSSSLIRSLSESETESVITTKQRSKRRRRTVMMNMDMDVFTIPPNPCSSVTVTNFSVEEVALCLLKLKKDTCWRRAEQAAADEAEEQTRKLFKCEKCDKRFPSYQSLGGHKSSHKKTNINNNTSVVLKSAYECPYCHKVFESGQALGGHKKVHFSFSPRTCGKSGGSIYVDLN